MKKSRSFVSILLILLLAFPCIATADSSMDAYNLSLEECLAEGMTIEEIAVICYQASPDAFSDYSDNYLKLLIATMRIELQQRGFTQGEVTVPVGEYIVGADIPAGTYMLTAHNLTDIEVYSNSKCVHNHCLTSSEQIGKLPLEDGQVVKIKYGSVVFAPYKGLGF